MRKPPSELRYPEGMKSTAKRVFRQRAALSVQDRVRPPPRSQPAAGLVMNGGHAESNANTRPGRVTRPALSYPCNHPNCPQNNSLDVERNAIRLRMRFGSKLLASPGQIAARGVGYWVIAAAAAAAALGSMLVARHRG